MSQKENLFLVFDQGGHATRGLVFDESENIVCRAECSIETFTKGERIVEHDPVEMIDSFFQVLEELEILLGDDFFKISQAGLATQRSSLVCWDRLSGNALSPIVSWQDRRALSDIPQFENVKDQIHEKTGLYLNPHYGATKMRWLLANEPSLNECLASGNLSMAPLASFILFHLLKGRPFCVDPANASRTLLMDYKKLCWDEFLLSTFGIASSVLPDIYHTKADYGVLKYKQTEIPLRVCTGDQSAAIYMMGEPSSDTVYANIGTGAFLQQYNNLPPQLDNEKVLASIVYASQNKRAYVIEGTVNGAGSAFEWLAKKTGFGGYSKKLDEWSARHPSPPIFMNGVSGVGSPFWVSDMKSYFLSDDSIEAQFVGVLESLVFLMQANLSAIERIGHAMSRIIVSGGLSNSHVICQKLADLSCMRVSRTRETEATALGVFFLLKGESFEQQMICEDFLPSNNVSLNQRYIEWLKEMRLLCNHDLLKP